MDVKEEEVQQSSERAFSFAHTPAVVELAVEPDDGAHPNPDACADGDRYHGDGDSNEVEEPWRGRWGDGNGYHGNGDGKEPLIGR